MRTVTATAAAPLRKRPRGNCLFISPSLIVVRGPAPKRSNTGGDAQSVFPLPLCSPMTAQASLRVMSYDHVRRTKIVATIGPASSSLDRIRALVRAGMDGARLNFSHGAHEEHAEHARLVRAV